MPGAIPQLCHERSARPLPAGASRLAEVPVHAAASLREGAAAVPSPEAVRPPAWLANREIRRGTFRGRLPFRSRQRRTNQAPVNGTFFPGAAGGLILPRIPGIARFV